MTCRSARPVWVGVLVAVLALCVWSASACASVLTPGAGWELSARTFPTNLALGGRGTIMVTVLNVGAASSTGTVTATDTLPAGVTATEAGEFERFNGEDGSAVIGHSLWDCTGNGSGGGVAGATVVTCTNDLVGMPSLAGGGGGLTLNGKSGPYLDPQIAIAVNVPGVAVSEPNRVTVAGGGAKVSASAVDPVTVSSTPARFGFVGWNVWFSNADGTPDTQAGSHPYAATFSFALASVFSRNAAGFVPVGGEPRDFVISLPAGLTGDPNAVAKCTRQQLDGERCPEASQVGTAVARIFDGSALFRNKVFNMVPPAGVPAELGFALENVESRLDVGVRTGGDYGVTVHANDTPERGVVDVVTTLWGVPGDPSHDIWRSTTIGGCSPEELEKHECPSSSKLATSGAFLTLPSLCAGPQAFSLGGNTWFDLSATLEAEAEVLSQDRNGDPVGFTGCEHVGFSPSLAVAPDTSRADTPAGLTADVKFPEEGLTEPAQLAPGDLRDATVTLPEGLVVNPGQATGLVACQPAQDAIGTEGAASCPGASRIGTALISAPALSEVVEGGVYLMQSNPPDIQLLIAGSADGVNIKVLGNVHLDGGTGRLTAVFQNIPQQPVGEIKLSFDGGPQAALTTPRACGVFTTGADFTPWSTPFTPDATPISQFAVQEGVGGGGCPNGEPFAPSAMAGMVNNQAGGFSPLSAMFTRQDPEQDVSGVSLTTPPGLLAILKGVERCPEPQATLGACGQGSLIGHTTVAVGAGPDPFYVQGGQVFLTGPYKGAPLGLSVVVPAVAGPFDLGNVIVRAAISVDPHTAQPTISSDPLPRILDGVPLQVKLVSVSVDRPGFMFNPTDCEPLAVTGSLTSVQGMVAPVSTRFQATNCTALGFHPVFSVSTQARTSKQSGASLVVKAKFPTGAQANIHSVAVVLPKQLPSRLTTIQQACTQAAFAANPAGCPAGSVIGTATASTPVFASTFTGPVYLVSHGGAAFPDVVMVLQGEGITLDVVGGVNIKHGVTSSTFANIPDAPLSSFQLNLPEGPHSGLAAVVPAKAKGSMCGQKLAMPFAITAQNGAVLKQNVNIAVTGCPKAKKKKAKAKHTQRAHGKNKNKKKKG